METTSKYQRNYQKICYPECQKQGLHEGELSNLFCLNAECAKDNIICQICKEEKHEKHDVRHIGLIAHHLKYILNNFDEEKGNKDINQIMDFIKSNRAKIFDAIDQQRQQFTTKIQKIEELLNVFFDEMMKQAELKFFQKVDLEESFKKFQAQEYEYVEFAEQFKKAFMGLQQFFDSKDLDNHVQQQNNFNKKYSLDQDQITKKFEKIFKDIDDSMSNLSKQQTKLFEKVQNSIKINEIDKIWNDKIVIQGKIINKEKFNLIDQSEVQETNCQYIGENNIKKLYNNKKPNNSAFIYRNDSDYMKFDLKQVRDLGKVHFDLYNSDKRKYQIELQASENDIDWIELAKEQKYSDTFDIEFEFSFSVRYLKVRAKCESTSTWDGLHITGLAFYQI